MIPPETTKCIAPHYNKTKNIRQKIHDWEYFYEKENYMYYYFNNNGGNRL